MTRDDVIRAAGEAGFRTGNITLSSGDPLPFVAPLSATTCIVELERFAALIEDAATEKANERANTSWALMCEKMVAAEREAILVDVVAPILAGCTVSKYATSRECASAREMAKAIDDTTINSLVSYDFT